MISRRPRVAWRQTNPARTWQDPCFAASTRFEPELNTPLLHLPVKAHLPRRERSQYQQLCWTKSLQHPGSPEVKSSPATRLNFVQPASFASIVATLGN